MVRNTLAVQIGADPSTATISFFWCNDDWGGPSSFFAEEGSHWFWPGQAIRLDDVLLVFMTEVAPTSDGLGFANVGYRVVRVLNPDQDPWQWVYFTADAAPNPWQLVPTAGLADDGDYLVGYAYSEPAHDLYLVRWPRAAAHDGDLSAPEWWNGTAFVAQPALASPPPPVAHDIATEFSVSPRGTGFVLVDSDGFGATEVDVRTAPTRQGPWSRPAHAYRPPEDDRSGVFTYAGKAHPELSGGEMVVTYASNHQDFGTLVADQSLYYPRFVRVTFR
jgi:hypothetical protein